jgi:hypothetical protein
VIRPRGGGSGRLIVRLAYQHLAERAIYEGLAPVPDPLRPDRPPVADTPPNPVDGENARPQPPVEARPARTTRLVFELAAGDAVDFSTEGILEAIGRLPMLVHPLAKPRTGRFRIPEDGPAFNLPGGLVATAGAGAVVVSRAARRSSVPDTATSAGLARLARETRQARTLLATRAGTTAARVGDAPALGGGEITIGTERHSIRDLLGDAGLVRHDIVFRPRPRASFSRPPRQFETSIEAPFRLAISPSNLGGWKHAVRPVAPQAAPHRVELWHTRLGVRAAEGDRVTVDERRGPQRVIRAVWARDREGPAIYEGTGIPFPEWERLKVATHGDEPFRTSLDGSDRHMLVRQSAETWLGEHRTPIQPEPVDVEGLWLSALGAWLDLHGNWRTLPYSAVQIASILKWDHVAPLGRDQYVRVLYPGYLYPFGHRATLVKLTERKMKDAAPSTAGLYQRKFLVVTEPRKTYSQRDLPYTQVELEPLVTPTLSPDPGNAQNSFFIPMVANARFPFVLHCLDHELRPSRLVTPLLWVAEHFSSAADRAAVEAFYRGDPASLVAADGQEIAFAPVAKGGDTVTPAASLKFDGDAQLGTSRPRLASASVEVPVVQQLSPVGPVTIEYAKAYLDNGFGGTHNAGEVWAKLTSPPTLSFGKPSAGSDRAGGFIQPDLPIAGLSRIKGTVGDPDNVAKGDFDPVAFLGGALPKLFGLVKLTDILDAVGVDLDDAPDVVSEALDRIEGFLADLERAKQAAQAAVDEANLLVQRAASKTAALQNEAQAAVTAAGQLQAKVTGAVDAVVATLGTLAGATEAQVAAALAVPLQNLRDATDDMEALAPQLPPLVGQQLRQLAKVLRQVADAADLVEDLVRFVNGLATGGVQATFRFEWVPKLKSWPSAAQPVLELGPRALVIAVDGRAAKDGMNVEVLAELKDFTLHLLPGAPLVRFRFDHLSFHGGSSGKADVDVVLQQIEFVGILSFVETLRRLIPFDGFSDPPFLDVTPEGLTAGFTLALPNVSVGVFNLSNISLGADVQVPFLGKTVTVGFNFCTRERPFTLAVLFIGGGGWFLIRLSPDGLDVLELGLEAGAVLAVDLGIASGSISAMVGIYMRLEGEKGSLTGYFRLRGEVDVLGLISASIELYLALTYQFDTGKMIGQARLTIKVEVFFLSFSVSVTVERRLAGSAGDPSFRDVMVLPNGTAPAWTDYCLAFAA